MSQIYKPQTATPPPPGFLETLTGDSGGAVHPDGADNINVLGDPTAPGIVTRGVPGTHTLYIGLMEPTVCGMGQTVNTSTVTLVTIPLGTSAATYTFDAVIAGKAATQSGIGGTAFGVFKTDGTTATIIGTVAVAANFDLVLGGASFTLSASGGSVILTATGSLGTVINWNGCVTYTSVVGGI